MNVDTKAYLVLMVGGAVQLCFVPRLSSDDVVTGEGGRGVTLGCEQPHGTLTPKQLMKETRARVGVSAGL